MFKLIGKTTNSLSFRQEVEPYIINQKQVDDYNALSDEEKQFVDEVKPIYLNYKEYGVFNQRVITNREEIDAQREKTMLLTLEELEQIEIIEPVYKNINDYTDYFGKITDYNSQEFQDACAKYLSDKGL